MDNEEINLRAAFQIPSPSPDQVNRDRCINLMKREEHRSLFFLSAPIGYGKTSLLVDRANMLRARKVPIGWIKLDQCGQTLGSCLCALVQACSDLEADVSSELLEQSKQIESEAWSTHLQKLLDKFIEALHRLTEFHLFLDGYEAMKHPETHRFWEYVFSHSHDTHHFYIASREKPPAYIHSLHHVTRPLIVTHEHLKYDKAEIQQYISKKAHYQLGEIEIDQLQKKTEGWPIALDIFASLLDGSRASTMNIATATSALQHAMYDFFLQNMYVTLEPHIQRVMLITSLPDTFDVDMCQDLMENTDVANYLDLIMQRGLLLFQDIEGRYRWHPLFVQFLRQQFQQKDKTLYIQFQKRYMSYFFQEGRLLEALHHALAMQDYDQVCKLLLQDVTVTFSYGKNRVLSILEPFPPREIMKRPSVAMIYAWLLTSVQRMTTAQTVLDQIMMQIKDQEIVFEPTGEDLRGYITSIYSRIFFLRRDTENGMKYLIETEKRLNGQGYLYSHNHTIDRRESSLMKTEVGHWGIIDQAHVMCEYALPRWKGVNQGYSTILILLGECYYERNRLSDAEPLLWEGRSIAIDIMNTGLILPTTICLIQLYRARGDNQDAQILLMETMNMLMHKEEDPIEVLEACKIRIEIKNHSIETIKIWINNQKHLTGTMWEMRYLYEHLTLLRAFICLQQCHEGTTFGERLLHYCQSMYLHYYIAETQLLLAILYDLYGDSSTALRRLEKSLEIGQAEGYIRLYVDEWESLQPLWKKLLRKIQNNELQLSSKLLAYIEQLQTHFDEQVFVLDKMHFARNKLTTKEFQVLQLMIDDQSNAQIAESLSVTVETVKSHCKSIYRKLHMKNRKQVMRMFVKEE